MGDLGAISTAPVAPTGNYAFDTIEEANAFREAREADLGLDPRLNHLVDYPSRERAELAQERANQPPEKAWLPDPMPERDPGDWLQKLPSPSVELYAHGGYASRGTVAGELPDYGDMSVRVKGESMRELAKRHKDQRWYNRMGGGLGSLMRRA